MYQERPSYLKPAQLYAEVILGFFYVFLKLGCIFLY